MKGKIAAGIVLAIFTQVVHAAPIVWNSQSYNISSTSLIDSPTSAIYSNSFSANNVAGLPLSDPSSLSVGGGSVSSNTAIANLTDANANIFEFTLNAASSYSSGTTSNQFAYAVPTASLRNTFTASTTTLAFGYDYDVSTSMSAPTPGLLTFQDFHVSLQLRDLTAGTTQTFSLFDHFLTSQVTTPALLDFLVDPAGESHTFSNSGTQVFNLVQGNTYELNYSGGAPFVVTRGDVATNSINSQFTLSFSDSVTTVPEPETYALMLAGLALVGFSARRKQRA